MTPTLSPSVPPAVPRPASEAAREAVAVDTAEVQAHAEAVRDHVHELGHPGPPELVMADLLLLSERVTALCDDLDATRARLAAAERDLADLRAAVVEWAKVTPWHMENTEWTPAGNAPTGDCQSCGHPYPCPTERLHRLASGDPS